MPIQFIWNESYSVGNSEIDQQHQSWFDLANSLPEKLDRVLIKHTIMDLFTYTRKHFTAEETMMLEIGYPKLDAHKVLHDDLITKLSEIGLESFQGDQSVFAFKKFIYDWIIDHIMRHDKDYFRFVQQKQSQ